MTKYEKVFRWEVLDKIRENKRVYVVDRKMIGVLNSIQAVNTMETQLVCEILDYKKEDNRFDFFTVEVVDDEK